MKNVLICTLENNWGNDEVIVFNNEKDMIDYLSARGKGKAEITSQFDNNISGKYGICLDEFKAVWGKMA